VVRVEEDLGDDIDWEHVPEAVDLVVPRGPWVEAMTRSAGPEIQLGATRLRAVDAVDLVVLKLYAGGRRDGWDVASLLDVHPRQDELAAAVEARLPALPKRCARLWRRLRAADEEGGG
jgi:hypothetical protein